MRICTHIVPAAFAAPIALAAIAAGAPLPAQTPIEVTDPPVLPAAIASFGAARSGDWLYVCGGHVGRAHEHSRRNVVADFHRLDLREGTTWERLPDGRALQGTALVAHADALYRIGGVTACNEPDEDEDMHSTASVQRYDPRAHTWTELTPLPEPRSSHDACVIGDEVFVAGGWCLAGDEPPAWHATAWVADLTQTPLRWRPLPPPPAPRRALALARLGTDLAVLGGMTAESRSTSAVTIYDPATGTWSAGPDLPGSGFGIAATSIGDAVLASGSDGRLLRLPPGARAWEPTGALLLPRFFHRLVPVDDDRLLAIGGAGKGGHMRNVEVCALDGTLLVQRWRVPVPTTARNRFGLVLQDNRLHVFGGNRTRAQHDFAPDSFADEAFTLNLATLQAAPAPPLPEPRQSMDAVLADGTLLAIGGFGHDGEVARAHAAIFARPAGTAAWSRLAAALPEPRTQFQTVLHEGRLWILGGADYDPRRGDEEAFRHPLDVPALDPAADACDAGVRLPRPRRAFGLATVGGKVHLIGGMRDGFEIVTEVDVLDLGTRTWTVAPAPARPRLAPQVAAIGTRIYVAGGRSPSGEDGFEPNPALEVLEVLEPGLPWRTEVDELPLPARHVQMRAANGHLVFVSLHGEPQGTLSLWALRPPSAPAPPPAAPFHR